jgi:D-lactate dehydrogenase (cytochrome)
MSTNRLTIEQLLSADARAALDAFCTPGRDLPALAKFLHERFAVELALDPDIVCGYAADQSNLPGQAQALARPATARECAILMHACHQAQLPLTLSGGRSNLTGSATPQGGVVLSTARMLAPAPVVDAARQFVSAPIGMFLEDLRKEVLRQSEARLIYPVDPTSRAEASVGGTIACNASGFVPGAQGATRDWVAALDFLLPDGRLVRAERGQYVSQGGRFLLADGDRVTELPVPTYPRPTIKNAGGPFSKPDGAMDFIDFVIGSEGLYGLVTACTLRLKPKPQALLDLFFPLPAENDAVKFLHFVSTKLNGRLEQLSALEYFGVNARQHMKHEAALFRGDNQVAIYLQVPLHDQPLEDAAAEWLGLIEEADCRIDPDAILMLDNEQSWKQFMEARHSLPANALEVVQRRGTFTIMTDAAVPPEHFSEFLDFTHGILKRAGMDYLAFGHLGDCHLHFTLLPEKKDLELGVELYDQIIARAAELGGVYSGEHGTGKRKRKDFLRCYGPAAAAQLLDCKRALDPHLLLNRNNVVEISNAKTQS